MDVLAVIQVWISIVLIGKLSVGLFTWKIPSRDDITERFDSIIEMIRGLRDELKKIITDVRITIQIHIDNLI